jgi:DNA-binding Lrp family transcriptional regulator
MEPYEGINAYVFVEDAHEADLDRMRGLVGGGSADMVQGAPGMRAVGILNGPYDAIVAVGVDTLDELRRIVMQDIRGGQSPKTETVIALRPTLRPIPMSPDLPPVVAFVRVKVQSGRANDVLEAVEGISGFVGAVLVAGSFDLLLEFGRNSVDEVAEVLLEELQAIDGIASTVTSLAGEVVHPG